MKKARLDRLAFVYRPNRIFSQTIADDKEFEMIRTQTISPAVAEVTRDENGIVNSVVSPTI